LLIYLIENRSRLVRKQELLTKVWPDAMVTENALTRAIGLLRKALNEESGVPRFIETVPTAGYRFIAKVTVVVESAAVEPITQTKSTPTAATRGAGFKASKKRSFASTVLLLSVVAAATFLFFFYGKKVLTEKDTVVLADFDNSTGDPVFDGTLRQGTAVQLEQSPFLSLISDERIQHMLRLMGQPADARLTPAIAREICERTASRAVLDGSIALLGSQFVLGVRAKDCHSGEVAAILYLEFHTSFAYYSPMGGERAATARMRINGEICCSCKRFLPMPHTPGEKYCTQCKPPLKGVYVAFERMRKVSWHVVFSNSHTHKRLCTLVFQDEVKLYELAKRGRALTNLEAKQAMELAIADGKGGLFLQLSPEQYAKLKGNREDRPCHRRSNSPGRTNLIGFGDGQSSNFHARFKSYNWI
jgi:DNA-binding winged helix-turn-helix (wHTH) protein